MYCPAESWPVAVTEQELPAAAVQVSVGLVLPFEVKVNPEAVTETRLGVSELPVLL